MHDSSHDDPGPHVDHDGRSFLRMSNILDIASAAGECADLMRSDFECDTEATLAAMLLVREVRAAPSRWHDRAGAAYDVSRWSAREWAAIHGRVLEEGFSVYSRLREHSVVALDRGYEVPLARLGRLISAGYRLRDHVGASKRIAA